MRYLEGFRGGDAARALAHRLRETGELLAAAGRTVRIMEVCGTHTMAIARSGIRGLLPPSIQLVSGPGCPVCVTDAGYVDVAVALADEGHVVATFGDMVRVPGSRDTLAAARARGGRVEVCYSPDAALTLAEANPDRQVVFLAIGFETTIAPAIGLLDELVRRDTPNVSLLTAFKLVPPALSALASDPDVAVDAFLAPAHVSAIIGSEAYRPYVDAGVPVVVGGFEALDILYALDALARQLAEGRAELENHYDRVVKPQGNARAQALMATYLTPVDASWRGIGVIPGSGLGIRPELERFDAEPRLGRRVTPGVPHPGCRCGEVLKAMMAPPDCPLFGKGCTPDRPIGPCMVSSEGSCAAYYKYLRQPPREREL